MVVDCLYRFMKVQYAILLLFSLLTVRLHAQYGIERDTVRLRKDSLVTIPHKDIISYDKAIDALNSKEPEVHKPSGEVSGMNVDFKLYRPFYVPLYYTNPSPMFYGDYSTSGRILPNFYGIASQNTLPGLGRINQVSFMYGWTSDYFDVQAGVSATKYSLPYSIGQSFGVFGTLIYHPGDRFHIKLFGSYSPDSRYNFNKSSYGATVGFDMTDRFGIEVGAQRYYEPQKGWKTAPIAIPYYKFNKFKFGIDMGGLLYDGIRNAVDK